MVPNRSPGEGLRLGFIKVRSNGDDLKYLKTYINFDNYSGF
jgi:hypothetical protein